LCHLLPTFKYRRFLCPHEKDMPDQTDVNVKSFPPFSCEPASLGLTGLAVAALVLASADLGLTGTNKALMIPWAIFLGATGQLIAGLMDFKRGNMFGATAFTTYSLLWYSVGVTLFIIYFKDPNIVIDIRHYAWGLVGFVIFSLILTVASLMTNKVLFGILVFIDLAIGTLAAHYLLTGIPELSVGVFLIGVSVLSFYGAAAVLLNTMAGKTILPMGKPFWAPRR
jgi:succinate-acetate transporter protein